MSLIFPSIFPDISLNKLQFAEYNLIRLLNFYTSSSSATSLESLIMFLVKPFASISTSVFLEIRELWFIIEKQKLFYLIRLKKL